MGSAVMQLPARRLCPLSLPRDQLSLLQRQPRGALLAGRSNSTRPLAFLTLSTFSDFTKMETPRSCGGGLGVSTCGEDSFLHFAYASNLLRERILLKNPSATFYAVANLQDFKLVFGNHRGKASSYWHGSTATIVQSPGDEVWGVVWKLNASNLNSLDQQEGVEDGIYSPIEVNVPTQEGKVLTCRSYQMNDCVCDLPSPQYKKVICMGAKQNGLPTAYQKKLEAIETNNYAGPLSIFEEIEAAIKETETTTQ